MKLAWVASGLFAGFGLAAVPAQAGDHVGVGLSVHYRHQSHRHEPRRAGGLQAAYERGYHHGLKAGAKDWRRERRFDYWRHRRYRRADSGFRMRHGPRHVYKRAYRAGFERGYSRGYGPARDWRHSRGRRPLPRKGRYIYEEPPRHRRW